MNKRTLQLSSPEYTDNNSNKKFISKNMANQNSAGYVFSWEMMKEDLQSIINDMEELKEENLQLKNEIKKLTSRIEYIDRRSRSPNLVVSGLKYSNVQNKCDISKNDSKTKDVFI